MYEKIIKIIIAITATLIILLLLAYGVSKSDFNNLKKYDEKDSVRAGLKERIAKEQYYTTKVKIKSDNMASLGDFTLNLSGNRKLTANISLKFKDNENSSWMSGESIQQEILDKGVVLRDAVINTISNSQNARVSNDKMKKELVDNMNDYLSNGEIEEIYFNKFIIQ